ncbi:hypothetical protein [Paenibacillus radicis (ex Gao et al. 2016)]|uniref:Uncharacterized protein n=1 Tax=Paenibacillus radicis (ex Gao et al. 2016) TaxID=1737354 RepID=A0A917HCM9_9BACL|nr:hypothetical protein [Paenibacillus radicis (ex Gao et al. 2016)]GGG73612.1 hypothetical protein GCM10010918_32140 [Paenibacillus radicis (ex Gao et al. 2016)]
MDKNERSTEEDLVTEKDIDDKFGLFAEEPQSQVLPTASERLAASYPRRSALKKRE